MALDAKDIDRLRESVPPAHRPPSDAGGLLSEHFSTSDAPVGGVDRTARAQDRERFNLGLAALDGLEDGRAPGFLLPGPLVAIRNAREDQRKREDDRSAERRALDQLLDAIEARLAALDAELLAIDKRLAEIVGRRAEIGESLESLDEIDRLRRSGKFDPKNPQHARLLKQAGISEQDANGDLAAAIARQRSSLDREDGALGVEWNDKLKRRDEIIVERVGAVAARAEIENANSAEARIWAAQRASTTIGAQQLGEAAFWSKSKDAKLVAADAVVAQEAEPARAESESITRDSVIDKSALFSSNANAFKP